MPAELPERPPLDLRKDGHIWTVEPYRGGNRSGSTLASHASRLDAIGEARDIMDDRRHPCLLEWQSEDSVCNLYWNPLFETLQVEHDELLDAWVVTTPDSAVALTTGTAFRPVVDQAKSIQRRCHFKKLRVYDGDGSARGTREHRFLKHRITDSGVKFNRKAIESPPDVDRAPADESTAEKTSPLADAPASPGQLAIQVPDITDVDVVDTGGLLNHFRTPWDGDEAGGHRGRDNEPTADILALAPEYASDETVAAFKTQLQRWFAADSHDHVATVYEWGLSPTPTVAFATGTPLSAWSPFDLDRKGRLGIVSQLAEAVEAWPREDAVPGITPESVYVHPDSGDAPTADSDTPQVFLTRCGLEWRLREAVGDRHVTPFVAPEQLQGRVRSTTAVYQVAALAYWLLCERPPIEAKPLDRAILTGQIREPQFGGDGRCDDVLLKGLANDPADRYGSVIEIQQDFFNAVTQ